METILREALFDYIKTADNPSSDLRKLLQTYYSYEPSMSQRITAVFQLANVKYNGEYVNGFTTELVDQSRIDLETKEEE